MDGYIKLGIAALLPVLAAGALYLLNKKTAFGKLNEKIRQILLGVVFGALAVIGTEWGIPLNGAQVNCRDAAVLIAGLMFGAPAGIIAGVIGGVERWIAVAWGIGGFTRVACTASTVFAGIYAAVLRRYMFENKKPGFFISLAIGVVMEVIHLTMVFITNMATPQEAMAVVKACTVPMIVANGISVMLASLLISFLSREQISLRRNTNARISQTIQRWLLLTVVLAFIATSFFVYNLQDKIAARQTDSLLDIAINEISSDIEDASNQNLLTITARIAGDFTEGSLEDLAERYGVSEISKIDENGIIFSSTVDAFVGYDMASGEQSAEFLCLLDDKTEYVQNYGPISYDPSVSRKYAGVSTSYGFVQVGYDAERFQKDIGSLVLGISENRHVGETGYILIMDNSNNVVSRPKNFASIIKERKSEHATMTEEDVTYRLNMYGTSCFCRMERTEGYKIIAVLPEDEALQMRNIALYVNTFMEILVFAVLFGLIYLLIKRIVVNRIMRINESLAKITGGDLNEVVNVRSQEEFASLSDDINSTVDTLKRYIDEASARIDQELEFAKNIQSSALPSVFPAFPKRRDLDIFAQMDPAKEVGGDFYDFYLTHSDTLNFLVADVSGKGIPAAMFMMRAKTELKSLTEADMALCDIFTHGNAALCEGNDAGMFVTAWQGSVDLTTGLLQYANAGHNPPLICRAGGKFEYLRSRAGFVLAGMDGVRYKTQELQLAPGDIVYLYTDGVTEATNANNALYGEDRLLNAINSRAFESMQELCTFIKADVDAFVADAPQFDDITMVAFRYIGQPPVPSIHFEKAALEDITAVTDFAEAELEKIGCPMKTVIQINVAIDEIFSNIVRYGYPDGAGPVTVELIEKEEPHAVYVRFCDEGIPYNPLTKSDPDVTLSAEERSIGGLGIYMVKKTMDDVKYKYENGQNILTIRKTL